MVGHQTETEDVHSDAMFAGDQQFYKRQVVTGLAKNLRAAIAAIKYMINNTALGGSCGSWHKTGS